METARGDYLDMTPELEAELRTEEGGDEPAAGLPDLATLKAALRENGGSPTRTAKALGLKNRYVLLRLMKKYGLEAQLEEEGS